MIVPPVMVIFPDAPTDIAAAYSDLMVPPVIIYFPLDALIVSGFPPPSTLAPTELIVPPFIYIVHVELFLTAFDDVAVIVPELMITESSDLPPLTTANPVASFIIVAPSTIIVPVVPE